MEFVLYPTYAARAKTKRAREEGWREWEAASEK